MVGAISSWSAACLWVGCILLLFFAQRGVSFWRAGKYIGADKVPTFYAQEQGMGCFAAIAERLTPGCRLHHHRDRHRRAAAAAPAQRGCTPQVCSQQTPRRHLTVAAARTASRAWAACQASRRVREWLCCWFVVDDGARRLAGDMAVAFSTANKGLFGRLSENDESGDVRACHGMFRSPARPDLRVVNDTVLDQIYSGALVALPLHCIDGCCRCVGGVVIALH